MLTAAAFAASAVNRWLLAGILSALAVLAAANYARIASRKQGTGRRGTRRRAGALVAIGPFVGLLCASEYGDLAVLIGLGAAALALGGAAIERSEHAERSTFAVVVGAALVAVMAGARFGPTGVGALDVIGAFAFVVAVMKSTDGFGNADGLAPGLGSLAGLGLFGIAAFGHQDGLASVLIGLAAACFAFLAYNLRPASLFIGRGGRLAIGFALAVGALAVQPVATPWRELVTPLIVLAIFIVDALIVVYYRLRRRRSLLEHRNDHIVHRLIALGWTSIEAVTFLLICQFILAAIALFTARGVMPWWLSLAGTGVVVLVVGIESGRARLEREAPSGMGVWARVVVVVIIVGLIVAVAPLAFAAKGTYDQMQLGRQAATRALNAARDGDTITAQGAFDQAARAFASAQDKIESPLLAGGLAVPFLASNVHAARTLADIGTDLADAGESLTVAIDPDALKVVGGRLPVEEVRKITPELEHGAQVLHDARLRLDDLRNDPYLVSQVRDAVDKVYGQLARADREAGHSASAAKLAPAIFGSEGDRTYLLVVQNNAESRATGGFIGSYALITAHDGKLHVGDMLRTNTWNTAVRAATDLTYQAPDDYKRRYTQYKPDTTLQNINLSPDFPSVAQALMSLAPQAGLPKVDGVLSVDPAGLAALLELTGPVTVPGWPTPIDAGNVVNVTLRDAYVTFARTPERADFLGDVAKAAVDEATSGTLGKPTQIAKVLGKAAHAGHLILAFSRPGEERLAVQLGVSGRMDPVQSDAIAVTSSNAAGNKIDYYLDRSVDYRVLVRPNNAGTSAQANASLSVTLDNTAPATGLPEAVIGPFLPNQFVAGENRALLSMYSPLRFAAATVDGATVAVAPGIERDRNVYSLFQELTSKQQHLTDVKLDGEVALHDGWYSLEVRAQPTLNPDRLNVSVDVPEGWTIDRAPHMERVFSRRANANLQLDKTRTFRVHIVRDPHTLNLWDRLSVGR